MEAKRNDKNAQITRSALTERFVEVYFDLYKARSVANMTDFCERIGLNPSNFAQMRKGRLDCSLMNICSMIEVYNVSPNWLFKNSGDMYQCRQ